MDANARSRDVTVDIAKGIGILLVYAGHAIEFAPGFAARSTFATIYAFHMPLFFLLSGYLLAPAMEAPRPWAATGTHLWRRLLYPYLAFGTLFLVTAVLRVGGLQSFGHPAAPGILANAFLGLLAGNPHPGIVIWFLYASAAVRLLLVALGPLVRHAGLTATAAVVTVGWIYAGLRWPDAARFHPTDYLRPSALAGFLSFTLLGAALRAPLDAWRRQVTVSRRRSIVLGLALALATVLASRMNAPVGAVMTGTALTENLFAPIFAAGVFGNPLAVLFSGILGTAAVVVTARAVDASALGRLLAATGRHSLGIFSLNGFALAFLNGPTATWLAERIGAQLVFVAMLAVAVLQWLAAWAVVGLYAHLTRRRAPGSTSARPRAGSASPYSPREIRASGRA
jgi:fucose 4-O-acetylase-like acetyltransferase